MTFSASASARVLAAALLTTILAACGGSPAATPEPSEKAATAAPSEAAAVDGNTTDGCIDSFAEGTDYFPDKVEFAHATSVSVEYADSYKVVEITTPDGKDPLRYVLLQCGADQPSLDGELADAQVIDVPVASVISLTTTNLPHFAELDAADAVVGVGVTDFVATPEILDRIESGDVTGYADSDGAPKREPVIGAQPDLLLMDAFGDAVVEDAARFAEAGVPTALNADFNEQELLGRAEWLKFTSLFLNREAAANEAFDEIESKYNEVADAAATAGDRPTVFLNTPYEATWFTPGGRSFFAGALDDANAEYVFAEDKSTFSLELDIETVLDKAGDADFWLQAGSVNGSLKDLAKQDPRFTKFKAFKTGQVWAYDKATTPGGGNAVFETAYTRADLFLADLVKILHPDALPDHETVFFGEVPGEKR